MTTTTDIRLCASNIIFPKRGQEVKVITWCGDWALCERERDGKKYRFWIAKSKLK